MPGYHMAYLKKHLHYARTNQILETSLFRSQVFILAHRYRKFLPCRHLHSGNWRRLT